MANEIIQQGNPFLRAAAQLRSSGKIDRVQVIEQAPAPRYSPRARLNFIPDDDTLFGMVNRALEAVSRGLTWNRGSILNLLV